MNKVQSAGVGLAIVVLVHFGTPSPVSLVDFLFWAGGLFSAYLVFKGAEDE